MSERIEMQKSDCFDGDHSDLPMGRFGGGDRPPE